MSAFICYEFFSSGVVEGGLGGAEPPLLKFHVDLGGLSPPPYNFCTLHNLKRECSLELHLQKLVQKP